MSVVNIAAEKIIDGYVFGEGIRWTGSDVILSDMIGRRVLKLDLANNKLETLYEVQGENQPNGLISMDDGSVLILSMFEGKVLRLKDGETSLYADLSGLITGYLGDVVMGVNGNLYVDDTGVRPFHGEKMGPGGRIILVKPNGEISVAAENLGFPNGITISPDGKTLYLAETIIGAVHAYDISEDGSLTNRRLHVDLSDRHEGQKGFPDGMGIDDEGGIWICLVFNNYIERYNAAGELTHSIHTPGLSPVACTIGGPDGKTMYITGTVDVEGEDHLEAILSGAVRSNIWTAKVPYGSKKARP
ncbi:MAG: SMP-30/gluconolactonase/LRE family protein [Emcibacter sp.]|nr:SMP-30/gluconolactonase/LRE family protein [Emcibacter sp.]